MALPVLNTIPQMQKVILDLYQRVSDLEVQLEEPTQSVDCSASTDAISDVEPSVKRRGRPPKVNL